MDAKTLGKMLRQARETAGWTQAEAAKRFKMTVSYLGKLERGERHAPLDTLTAMANTLGVNVTHFLEDATFGKRMKEEVAEHNMQPLIDVAKRKKLTRRQVAQLVRYAEKML